MKISSDTYMLMQATVMAGMTSGMDGDEAGAEIVKECVDGMLRENDCTICSSKIEHELHDILIQLESIDDSIVKGLSHLSDRVDHIS
jgi:hypothetical protein